MLIFFFSCWGNDLYSSLLAVYQQPNNIYCKLFHKYSIYLTGKFPLDTLDTNEHII